MGDWTGKTVLNAETMTLGKIVDSYNNYVHTLDIEFDDGTKQSVDMNNIVTSRESEIASQTKYQNVFWYMGKHADQDWGFQPFASSSMVKDPEYLESLKTKVKTFEKHYPATQVIELEAKPQ